ncbi:MAG: hypothetical protein IKQ54_10380 [Oscillospiraceae bacterium]|nr:hypothetical protein [Oscillospiraceae bacterium]
MQSGLLIRLPRRLFWVLLGIWAAGFAGVLVWPVVSHLRFRRSLLRGAAKQGPRNWSWRIVQVAPWTQPCTEESSADPSVCAAAEAALADKALAELPGQIRPTGKELGFLRMTRPEGGENDRTQAHVTVYDSGMLCCLENLDGAPRVWYQLREPPELRVLFDAAAVETPAE